MFIFKWHIPITHSVSRGSNTIKMATSNHNWSMSGNRITSKSCGTKENNTHESKSKGSTGYGSNESNSFEVKFG